MPRLLHRLARSLLHCYPWPRGQGRIVDRTWLSRLRFDEPTLKARCSDGFEMTIIPDDHIGRHLYLTGQFDRTIVEVLRSYCRGGERILDIGANVGYVSCALLHLVPQSRVVCVEPNPQVYRILAGNVAALGGDRAKALNLAVSDHDGTGAMTLHPGNTGANQIVDPAGAADGATIPVALISGPKLFELSGLDRLDLIKIDVEGHEQAVLRSLAPVIQQQRPRAVVFEHEGNLADPGSVIGGVFAQAGYQIFGIEKCLLRWSLKNVRDLLGSRRPAHDYVALPA
jgi:FkbM family methyltransferase